jgi:hypothetical protein
MRGVSPRVLLWVALLVVGAVVVLRLRHGDAKPDATLTKAAIPTAGAYARDVVSADRCANAKSLTTGSLSDPCKTFEELHGAHVVGVGRIVAGCGTVADTLKGGSRVAGADCVRFAITGPSGSGRIHVWLRHTSGGWRVAAAASELHRA